MKNKISKQFIQAAYSVDALLTEVTIDEAIDSTGFCCVDRARTANGEGIAMHFEPGNSDGVTVKKLYDSEEAEVGKTSLEVASSEIGTSGIIMSSDGTLVEIKNSDWRNFTNTAVVASTNIEINQAGEISQIQYDKYNPLTKTKTFSAILDVDKYMLAKNDDGRLFYISLDEKNCAEYYEVRINRDAWSAPNGITSKSLQELQELLSCLTEKCFPNIRRVAPKTSEPWTKVAPRTSGLYMFAQLYTIEDMELVESILASVEKRAEEIICSTERQLNMVTIKALKNGFFVPEVDPMSYAPQTCDMEFLKKSREQKYRRQDHGNIVAAE